MKRAEALRSRKRYRRHHGEGDEQASQCQIGTKRLDGLLAWIACIADAQPIKNYMEHLEAAGLHVKLTDRTMKRSSKSCIGHERSSFAPRSWSD